MKLWIDDIRPAPDEDWVVARTVTEAIRFIARFQDGIKEVSLDHDISHQVTVGSLGRPYPCEECFCAVAYYIAEIWFTQKGELLRPLAGPKITIHTSNPSGAEQMEYILAQAGIRSEIKMMGLSNRLEMEVKL